MKKIIILFCLSYSFLFASLGSLKGPWTLKIDTRGGKSSDWWGYDIREITFQAHSLDILVHTPFGIKIGPLTSRLSLLTTYTDLTISNCSGVVAKIQQYRPDIVYSEECNIYYNWFGFGTNISLAHLLFFDIHFGIDDFPDQNRFSFGITSENQPVDLSLGISGESYRWIDGNGIPVWFHKLGFTAGIGYTFGKRSQSKIGSGPSPSVSGQGTTGEIRRPGSTGSDEIDNFVNAAFDLNDKIVDLKEKVESVSSGLSEGNKVLAEIGSSSSGPVDWALKELTKGFSKSKNSITSAVQSLQSDVPDLPEIYFNLIKESMTDPNTLQELLKGTEPEEALVLTFNKKAKEKGVPTTSKDWIKGLNLDLDPTKALKTKLGKINDGVMGGKDKLVSIPDDLKAIGDQAQSLLGSAKELPKAAKSLGFSKAPAALKAIKATTGVLKNIPKEVTAIGDETKKVMEEIEDVLNNIKNILS